MKRLIAAALTTAATLVLATTAATATASVASLPTEEPSALTAMVTALSPAVASPGDRVTATVTLDNGAPVPIEDAVVSLSITAAPLADRAALDGFLEDPLAQATRRVAEVPEPPAPEEDADGEQGESTDAAGDDQDVAEPAPPAGITVAPGARSTVTVDATAEDLELTAGSWGVYGLVVELESGGATTVVDALPVTWAGAPIPSLDVAVLATATGTPTRVDAILDAADVEGVAVALDPTAISNATVFDHGLVDRAVYRLPGGLPDITSLAHGDDAEVLALSLSLPPASTVGAFGDAPWLATPAAIDRSSVTFAARHGAAAVIAAPEAVGVEDAADAGTAAVRAAVDDGSATVLVPDAVLSTTLADYRPGTPAAAATVVAQSALAAADADGPILIAPGPAWRLGGPGPSESLTALADAPWTTMVPLADVLDAEAPTAPLRDALDTDNDLAASTIAALGDRVDGLRTLATTTALPGLALTDWGAPIARSVPTSLRGSEGPRRAAIAEALGVVDSTLAGVRIAESSDLNLLADSGDVPVTVINALDRPVTVTVDLASLSPSLQVQNAPTATVPAGQELLVPVTVEAVSSGNVGVSVVLRAPGGELVSEVSRFSIRIRADWGTAATATFTALLVLLLIAGLVRTVRRGRKDTRSRPGRAPATVAGTPTGEAGDGDDAGDTAAEDASQADGADGEPAREAKDD